MRIAAPSSRLAAAILIAGAGAMLTLPGLIQVIGLAADPSFIDNHPPLSFPQPSLRTLRSYPEQLTAYLRNRVAFRWTAVTINHVVRKLFGVSGVPNLVAGKNGWQFLSTPDYITDQYRGINRFSAPELDRWISGMEAYQRALAADGIKAVFIIPPNQQTIYAEYMPDFINRVDPQTRMDQLFARLRERKSDLNIIDLRPALFDVKRIGPVYHRMEGHWTRLGAYTGFREAMRNLQPAFPRIDVPPIESYRFSVTRVRWPFEVRSETVLEIDRTRPNRVVASDVLCEPPDGLAVVRNTTNLADNPSAVIIGDSFAENLVYFFPDVFSWWVEIRHNSPSADFLFVRKLKPDIVIVEIVERLLNRDVDQFVAATPPPDLASLRVRNDAIASGVVEDIQQGARSVQFRGWSLHPTRREPPKWIVVFAGDMPIAWGRPTVARPDVTAGMADHNAGFTIETANASIYDAKLPIRFVSVFADGEQGLLNIYPPIQSRWDAIRSQHTASDAKVPAICN